MLCQEPASAFYVKPSEPVLTSGPSDIEGPDRSVVLGGFYALTIGRGRWVIYELVVDNGQTVGIETIALLDSDKTWAPVENVGFSICDPVVFEGRTAPRADVQKAARNLVSFLYLIKSDVGAPVRRERVEAKNRSERRRLDRWPELDIYDVEIRQPNLPLEYVFEDVHAGRLLGPRIAGATRKELKHSANRMSYVSTTERYDQFQRSLRIKDDDHA